MCLPATKVVEGWKLFAHVMTMDGVNGWRLEAAEIPEGAMLTVTPAKTSDLDKIRGLGFIGVMTVGMPSPATPPCHCNRAVASLKQR